jgi:hypothetical protein
MFPNNIISTAASVTRPADTTPYASGDLVANSTTAGSVVPLNLSALSTGPGLCSQIRRVVLSKTGVSVTNAAFRVHFFTTGTITAANGDNGAISTSGAANYLGSVDVTVGQAFTDGAVGVATCEINTGAAALYALIEARGAYTPASAEVLTLRVEAATR